MKRILPILAAALVFAAAPPAWQIGPFQRPAKVNPVIAPIKESSFHCPMRKTSVHW